MSYVAVTTKSSLRLSSESVSEQSTFAGNLKNFGYADPTAPSSISIYPRDFEGKNEVVRLLDEYNASMRKSGQRAKVIVYTDYIGALTSSITTIIDVITYVLIAFVSVSLVVSSIMIGIINTILSELQYYSYCGDAQSVKIERIWLFSSNYQYYTTPVSHC